MRRLMYIFIFIFIVTTNFCCNSEKNFLNPFDPDYDSDKWMPNNLQLEAINIHTIEISWEQVEENIDGFKIDRRVGYDDWEIEYTVIDRKIKSFIDRDAVPTEIIRYKVSAYAGDNESLSIEDTISLDFPAPSDLQIAQNSLSKYTLSWEDNCDGEDGYKIDKQVGNNTWDDNIVTLNANITSWTDEDISLNEINNYRVYAFCKNKNTDKIEQNIDAGFPAPTDLILEQISISKVKLSWNDNCSGEESYVIDKKIDEDNWIKEYKILDKNTESFLDTNSVPTENNSYRIYARAKGVDSDIVENDIYVIFDAPTDLALEQISISKVKLIWNDNCNGEELYIIDRKVGEDNWIVEYKILEKNTESFLDTDAIPTQNNSYRIYARAKGIDSDIVENDINVLFDAPTNLIINQRSLTEFELVWNDNSNGENGFKIDRKINKGVWDISFAEINENINLFIDNTVVQGNEYFYKVYGIFNNIKSNSVEDNIYNIFQAPSNLIANPLDENRIQLIWQDNSNFETGFKVERSLPGGSFSEIAEVSVNSTQYTDDGLIYGETYKYRIRAFTENQYSNYSDEVDIRTNIVVDIDGNIYKTEKIGNQWWMVEDLEVTCYRNGEAIPKITNDSEWTSLKSGAYCVYYFHLYNWYAVSDSRNIAPAGWHIPTSDDWEDLAQYISDDNGGYSKNGDNWIDVGTHLKTSWGWNSGGNGIDDYGFAGFPKGCRRYLGGFYYIGRYALYWSGTESDSDYAYYRCLSFNDTEFSRSKYIKENGLSVRCVRDK